MPFDAEANRNPLNLFPEAFPGGRNLAERLSRDWGWVLIGGLIYAFLGILALERPFAATVGLNWVLGILLIAAGIVQIVNLMRWRDHMGTIALQAIITLLAGGIMLRLPAIGLMGLTLILTFYLFVTAVGRWMSAAALRPHRGWGLMFLNSAVSFALGIILLFSFPLSSLWAPGLFLGVDLLVTGISMIALSFVLRSFLHSQPVTHAELPEEKRRAA